MITSTDPALWTRAPTTGFRMPRHGQEDGHKVQGHGKGQLHRMVPIIRRASRSRWGSS